MAQYKISIPVKIESFNDDSYWSDPEFLTVIVSADTPTEALHFTAESIQHLVRKDTGITAIDWEIFHEMVL